MITELSINGAPEKIPNTKFGSHFDGENFYFFESENEANEFREKIIELYPQTETE